MVVDIIIVILIIAYAVLGITTVGRWLKERYIDRPKQLAELEKLTVHLTEVELQARRKEIEVEEKQYEEAVKILAPYPIETEDVKTFLKDIAMFLPRSPNDGVYEYPTLRNKLNYILYQWDYITSRGWGGTEECPITFLSFSKSQDEPSDISKTEKEVSSTPTGPE